MLKKYIVVMLSGLMSFSLLACKSELSTQVVEMQSSESIMVDVETTPTETDSTSGSNTNTNVERKISNQTFEVSLESLGDVTFVSYLPDTEVNPNSDVIFQIEADGQVITQLPGAFQNNVGNEKFVSVDAVTFTDYNGDSYTDVIIILTYADASGSTHQTVRYYSGSFDETFSYNRAMSDYAAGTLVTFTIQEAKDLMDGFFNEDVEDAEWKEAYLNYLDNESNTSMQDGYTLIHMCDNNVPQLVEVGDSEATGCRIVNYSNGETSVTQLNRSYFTYIPGGNLLCNSDGLMDNYYDLVYSIVGGKMTLIASGNYGAEDNTNIQYDAHDNPIYRYFWNDMEVSKTSYKDILFSVYDTTRAITYNNVCSFSEIKERIINYTGSF